MALHGVLFLDELPEFDRSVLEVLREPMESGRITISRAARRADIQIEVPAVPQDNLLNKTEGEASIDMQARVEIARQRQLARQDKANAQLSVTEIDELCAPDQQGVALLQQAISRLNLSARAYHRVLKVARTIADLEGANNITTQHIAEAVQYRRLNL